MRQTRHKTESLRARAEHWTRAGCVIVALCAIATVEAGRSRQSSSKAIPRDVVEGRHLFAKVWEPGVPSPAGGDGLGPLYNETSCAACHHQSGIGGGGDNRFNVSILSAVDAQPDSQQMKRLFQGELEDLHPGFRSRTSVVIHRESTNSDDRRRLRSIETFQAVQTREDMLKLQHSTRNTPALFGAGLIDAIPDKVLLDAESRSFPKFPEIKGRASRLADARLGRFGWKSQTARLRDFVLAACSNELGLEVPGHHQVSLASAKDFDPSKLKLDLDAEQCSLMVRYVSNLPPPLQRPPDNGTAPPWGYMVFESIGCATCHAPRLGDLHGIYSDLLLHDLGDRISAGGGYGGPPSFMDLATAKDQARPSSGPAAPNEWRTPPLWGVADSAPFLHDGRAATLEEAIRLHGGEAAKTSARFAKLEKYDRKALLGFLNSLTVVPRAKPRKPAVKPVAHSRGCIM
jgi:CxxC motif-containing protein (DUF1111 family)